MRLLPLETQEAIYDEVYAALGTTSDLRSKLVHRFSRSAKNGGTRDLFLVTPVLLVMIHFEIFRLQQA